MMQQKDLFGKDTYESKPRVDTREKEILTKCPLCGGPLEHFIVHDNLHYDCRNDGEFCEHMIKVTDKTIHQFVCTNCDDDAEMCNCHDCMLIMCAECNDTLATDCHKVVEFMFKNEEKCQPSFLTRQTKGVEQK